MPKAASQKPLPLCERQLGTPLRPQGYGIHTSDSVIDQDGVIVIQTGSDEALGLDGGWVDSARPIGMKVEGLMA